MNYNAKLTEIVQYVLEPIQRQQNIILSFNSWLSGLQLIANTFSENLIPETQYLGNIVSSKGAFEWYLNQEFNIATFSSYQPIFIGTLPQSSTDLYGYNSITELEYDPLYFIQDNLPQKLSGLGITIYLENQTYTPNKITYVVPSLNTLFFVQNFGTQSIPPNTPPFVDGVFTNTDKWQTAVYGFNSVQAQTGSEDVDFIVWVPKYLNVGWQNPIGTAFDVQIRAYVTKYKMAHTSFTVNYY